MLWPEKPIEKAQRDLLDHLNDDRPHKLSFDQIVFILRKAKEAGYHDGMNYFCADVGYSSPTPIPTVDELADLMRDFNKRAAVQAAASARIEAAMQRLNLGVAA